MNKYIIQTIRAGIVLSIALFASANTAFASVYFIPAGATDITATSATINGEVANQNGNSHVWFEVSQDQYFNSPSITGNQAFLGGGHFESRLEGLNSGTTYYYRAWVSVEYRGMQPPVSSATVSFRTLQNVNSSGSGKIYKTVQGNQDNSTNNTQTTNTTTSNTSNSSKNSNSSSVKNSSSRTTSVASTKDGFTNDNSNTDGFSNNNSGASVIGAGDSLFPTTLVGWILLLIALFVVILVGRLIYEGSEKRKKIRAAKKAATVEAQNGSQFATA